MFRKLNLLFMAIVLCSMTVIAQDAQVRNLVSGQKYKIEGTVVSQTNDGFVVRDGVGIDTRVIVAPGTSVKETGIFGDKSYPATVLMRGLALKVEGRGDSIGNLVATKVRFDDDDLRVAQSLQSRIDPVEDRVTQTEQNAERLSGQIDELMAISNAARGGAKAAQDTADAAVAGVNATNQRISSLDDFVVQSTATVNFRTGSAELSPEGKQELDQVAQAAMTLRGYVLEVTGFTDSTGNAQANKLLSQKRAQSVIDYLVTTHNIPLRRIGTSYGFGELQAVADNSSREGRAENRRVEVKLLVSRGLNQNVEVRSATADDDDGQ